MNIRHTTTVAVAFAAVAAARWSAAAEGAAPGEGMGVLTIIFLAVGALVILGQAIPAALMFGSMLVSLFSPAKARERKEKDADLTA